MKFHHIVVWNWPLLSSWFTSSPTIARPTKSWNNKNYRANEKFGIKIKIVCVCFSLICGERRSWWRGAFHLVNTCTTNTRVWVQVWEALYERVSETERGMYITTLLLHPQSFGTIRLQSSNPQDDPLIDPRLLTNSEDVSTLIDGKCCIS